MDTPRIVLRFRDVAPGIDTIEAHREVISTQGSVWWGWWRKEFEPDPARLFEDLNRTAPGRVTILDKSTRRAFLAEYLQAARKLGDSDDTRIPRYYAGERNSVSGWLLLRTIIEQPYDNTLAERIGESTLLNLDAATAIPVPSPAAFAYDAVSQKTCVLHLSDLHFGGDYAFLPPKSRSAIGESRRSLTHCLLEDLTRIGLQNHIGLVIITGDFTTRGDWSDPTRTQIFEELKELRSRLGLENQHLVAIPGNHDVIRYPANPGVDVSTFVVAQQSTYQHERDFRLFQEELTGRRWQEPLNRCAAYSLGDTDVQLCALNSCTISATQWTEYGYVGVGSEALARMRALPIVKPTLRMMALHHHLLPVNRVEAPESKGVSLTLDAVDLLDAASEAGVQVALHGHQHLARVCVYERLPMMGGSSSVPLTIVAGGSAGANHSRLPGSERNTYSVLQISPQRVALRMRELRFDGKPGAELFNRDLPIRPRLPGDR